MDELEVLGIKPVEQLVEVGVVGGALEETADNVDVAELDVGLRLCRLGYVAIVELAQEEGALE